MLRQMLYKRVPVPLCFAWDFAHSEARSRLKHPHDCAAPLMRLCASDCVCFPQSQIQFHFVTALNVFSSVETTVNLPNRSPTNDLLYFALALILRCFPFPFVVFQPCNSIRHPFHRYAKRNVGERFQNLHIPRSFSKASEGRSRRLFSRVID